MTEPRTVRMAMVWPASLKDAVREKAGHGGMTEFVIEAVEAHLVGDKGIARERLEARQVAQDLADTLISTRTEDRLQAIMSLDLPAWIDSSEWPRGVSALPHTSDAEVVDRPKVEPREIVPPKPLQTHVHEVWKEPAGPAEGRSTNLTLEEPMEPPVDLKERDDLFARVMARAGNPDELEKHKDQFKAASDLPGPDWISDEATTTQEKLERFEALEPEPTEGPPPVAPRQHRHEPGMTCWCGHAEPLVNQSLCSKCGSQLVDGDCWECE